jgi:hypothetical protein
MTSHPSFIGIRSLLFVFIHTYGEPSTMTTISHPSVRRSLPSVRRSISRIVGLLLALIMVGTYVSLSSPSVSFAAERSGTTAHASARPTVDDPFATLTTKITTLATQLAKIATPIAILAIVFALILQLAGGFLPEIAQQNKGFIMRALVIVVIIGFIPQLVTALSSLGAAAGG